MRTRECLAWTALALALSLFVGCGSESEATDSSTGETSSGAASSGGSGSNIGLTPSSGGQSDIVVGTDPTAGDAGASSIGDGQRDGGSITLTRDQVRAIEGGACTGLSAEVEAVPAVLQFVVDISLSMDDPAPGGRRGETKWDVTRQALLDAIDGIPSQVAVGLQLYPNIPGIIGDRNPGCVSEDGRVPIALLGSAGSAQRTALASSLDGIELRMGTPTHDAYSFALDGALRPYEGYGNKFMLLITDGAPTQLLGCGVLSSDQAVDTAPILETIAGASASGIRTFLIGSPGSEGGRAGDMREWLSHGALIGGTALEGCSLNGPDFCHFDMSEATNFSAALAEGLGAITAQVADGCTFSPPTDAGSQDVNPDSTTVIIGWGDGTSALLLNDAHGACTDGWQFSDDGEIVLCERTCAQVNLDPLARVSVSLECSAKEIDDVVK